MMVWGPLSDAAVVGVILLLITITLRKLKISRVIINIPAILVVLGALGILYWSYTFIRGFEGAGLAFLSIFLIAFSIPSLIIANKKRKK